MTFLPDGLIVVAKRECPTCTLVEPLLAELASGAEPLIVYVQDDPRYAAGLAGQVYDETLEHSFRLGIEFVPTLIRMKDGLEVARTYGWHRGDWQDISGRPDLGESLPPMRPGCGSKTLDPGIAEELVVRFGDTGLVARQVDIGEGEDLMEACFDRGWTDGLPVVPPTPARVLRMLQGTTRRPDECIGEVPPDLAPCTVEKVAINAVMAGCKPEYLPVVLAAVEAALIDEFGMHGVLCTTMFAGPMVIVNGPVVASVGLNAGVNALGQGSRANATIGRALQLVIRNVGGGRPGEVDRATLGTPGKYTFCFAEAETPGWESLAVERGFAPDASVVTLFAAEGVQGIVDQKSREPESLARSFALCLRSVDHPKLAMAGDAVLVVSPEHARVFIDAGWSKARLRAELDALLLSPADDMLAGVGGIAEGLPASLAGTMVPKFRPGGLLIVRAGGTAGLFSAVIAGWAASGATGSTPVSKEITS
ncbi:thioredoxin family protein [Variovorax sp. PAMC 28711]|uniref:thioredoxin family protein n=1 Tax=Variovorax sp. PAMC 28711 TaxID=1795631 RepID=UPI00078E4C7A|nr:thioredoxin family protein [Variovorax sp. PAMC 28711]AMM24651.1 thiol-disulfide oxidoreductase [Variovorax sp. PAMC 28711]